MKLTKKHIENLTWAVGEAATWRGSIPEEAWPEFDSWIASAREAVQLLKQQLKKRK